ncbi:hypothetical protein KV102_02235 [Mumia sp. zg.B53]|uniref:hypothetical protein n=1 Tax=Mumia sp. zg.B53 TaxID=2855449 RepID=UPI001C6F178C|nr:hypothetical protein [Mumia sp. zg.B53]MBW9213650.1 hypothetical protein [Mumia sp. zg.B53]
MNGATASAIPLPVVERAGRDRGAVAFAWLWIAGALLASVALALLATVPALPTTADAVALWVDDASFQLTWAGEFLFFATIAWGTGAAGAFGAHGRGSPLRRTTALVALGVALIAFVVVLLALGRLVYPVADIELAVETIVLLESVVIGAVHLALLGLGIVAFTLPVPVRSTGARRATVTAGVALGVLFLVGSYPWLLPMWLNLVVAGAVGCWGALVGAAVLVRDRDAARS